MRCSARLPDFLLYLVGSVGYNEQVICGEHRAESFTCAKEEDLC